MTAQLKNCLSSWIPYSFISLLVDVLVVLFFLSYLCSQSSSIWRTYFSLSDPSIWPFANECILVAIKVRIVLCLYLLQARQNLIRYLLSYNTLYLGICTYTGITEFFGRTRIEEQLITVIRNTVLGITIVRFIHTNEWISITVLENVSFSLNHVRHSYVAA